MNLLPLIVVLLVGIAVLFLGRQLFWLFVGAVGFLVGFNLATQFMTAQPEWLQLLVGLIVGLVGALVAIPLQRLAIGVAGFLAGGYALLSLLQIWGVDRGLWLMVAFAVGGIVAAVLVVVLFDWAVIILSSLAGATLLVQPFDLTRPVATLAFLGLLILGIIVQATQMEGPPRRRVRRISREE